MAFLFGDAGGSHYLAADVLKKWSLSGGSVSVNTTGNPYGGPCLVLTLGSFVSKTLPSNYTGLAAAVRIQPLAGASINPTPIISFYDLANGIQVDLRSTVAGALQVTRNGTVLATSNVGLIVGGNAYHIQFKAVIDATTGSYAVRLNGVAPTGLPDATGVNTKAQTTSTVNNVRFTGIASGVNMNASDFYICDLTGSDNNDLPGDVKAATLFPSGAGNYSQWTPLSGANYTNVDETAFNGDTDYNSSGTVGQIDTYTMTDLASGYSVKAVQATLLMRKDDAGSRTIAHQFRQGATDTTGTTVSLLDTYTGFSMPLDRDPTDNTAWTAAKVNSIEYGVKTIS